MFWPRRHCSPIALDIDDQSVGAVQLHRTGSGWRVGAACAFARLEHDGLASPEAARIREILTRQGFEGDACIVCGADSAITCSPVEVPPNAAPEAVSAIAHAEIARSMERLPNTIESTAWALPPASRRAPQSQGAMRTVLAAACPHEPCEALLGPIEQAGLEPIAFEPRAAALARALTESRPDAGVHAAAWIGWESLSIVVTYAQSLVYARSAPHGALGRLHDGVRAELHVPAHLADRLLGGITLDRAEQGASDKPVDAAHKQTHRLLVKHLGFICDEIEESVSYALHRYPDSGEAMISLCGPGARLRGVDSFATERLGLRSDRLTPADWLECDEALQERLMDPALSVAAGLCAGWLNGGGS